VHFGDPVGQAFLDQLGDKRVVATYSVWTLGEIMAIKMFVSRIEEVKDAIIDTFEVDDRTVLVVLTGMVVDNVENNLQAMAMGGFDKIAKFAHVRRRVRRDAVA